MSKVSSKRQITLPVAQCRALDIHPGDDVECFVYQGCLAIAKKRPGAAKGLLKHIKPLADITDEESMLEEFN